MQDHDFDGYLTRHRADFTIHLSVKRLKLRH
jgi:hypothetical protein